MSDSIDDEVSAFAAQLEGLTSIDEATAEAQVTELTQQLASAPDNAAAVRVLSAFHTANMAHPLSYRRRVAASALTHLTLHMAFAAPAFAAPGLAGRIRDLAIACHGLGYAAETDA